MPMRYAERGGSRTTGRSSRVTTLPRMSARWATFDCYGTLVDWNGGIERELARLFGRERSGRLLDRYHELEPEVEADGSLSYRDVLASRATEGLVVKVRDLVAGKEALERAGFAVNPTSDSLTVHTDPKDAERVSMVLGREGLWVSELRAVEADLEKVFLELTTTIEGKGAS